MIKLVTISRISKEKGFDRMLKLEGLLVASGVAFIWDCYGDTSTRHAKEIIPRFRHVKFKGVTTEPKKVLQQFDYLVQLSDTEGFPYSIYEAMQEKVPVIATAFPSLAEMITDGVNGYVLDMNLSNFDAAKLEGIPVITEFKEKSTENDWIKFIDMETPKKKTRARGTRQTAAPTVSVKISRRYFDTQLDKHVNPGEVLTVSKKRAKELTDAAVGVEV